ncbi:MAG: spermidine synthase-like protein [Thermodesulfobacteriota bacterium]
MNREAPPRFRLHLAVALLSLALIAFQLEQMQLLALAQYHHFAYLVISVALLGFGAAGSLIAIRRRILLRHLNLLLPLLFFACGATMALALPISQRLANRFDICLLFVEPGQIFLLLLSQFIYFLLFFFGALPLGLIFIAHTRRINSLYCANLIGSGLGSITAMILMYQLLPQQLPALTGLLPWLGGCLVVSRQKSPLTLFGGGLSLLIITWLIVQPPTLNPSQYKAISRTLDLPGAEVTKQSPSPLGLVELVRTPLLRHAPGLSLTYTKEVGGMDGALFSNGDWFGPFGQKDLDFLEATTGALPYVMGVRQRVLLLRAGSGQALRHPLGHGASEVTAIEPHARAVELISKQLADTDANPWKDPRVTYSSRTPRSWLAFNPSHFDLILLPIIGSFGGSSGLSALTEQYLLSKEGFRELWDHLRPGGVISVSTWLDSPSRSPLRLAATIVETLEEAGSIPRHHVAAIRNWNMITFVVKRETLSADELQRIRSFCQRFQFDPTLLPGMTEDERQNYHIPADPDLFTHLDSLFSPTERAQLYDHYAFRLTPTTDDRPYFSQFLRYSSLPEMIELFGQRRLPFVELGYLLVLLGFIQMCAAALILIVLPLLRLGLPKRSGLQRWTLPYFGGLGLGYMFFEIALIHELSFFFGHPIFGAAAAISGLLIFSGVGSLISSRFQDIRCAPGLSTALVALLLLISLLSLPTFLQLTITLPTFTKILFVLLFIALPATVMGMPFPLGLAQLARDSRSQAAWAWGVNGCMSVVSSGLATIIAVELGFSAVLFFAAAAYGIAALAVCLSGWSGETV